MEYSYVKYDTVYDMMEKCMMMYMMYMTMMIYMMYMMMMIYMMYICADIVPRRLLLETTRHTTRNTLLHVRSEFLFTRK